MSIKKNKNKKDEATLILPGLWLGSEKDEKDKEWVTATGITHDVHATYTRPQVAAAKVCSVRIEDLPTENIYKHFEKTYKFIRKALDSGGKVFVHCQMGISRSASLIIAFLMKDRKMTLKQAKAFVEKKRDIINPNSGFLKQLKKWEDHLRKSS